MPYNRRYHKKKKVLNRRLRGGRNARYRKGFRKMGNTNSFYHAKVPRTLQIATRRDHSKMLRFVCNYTFLLHPQSNAAGPECMYLQLRANSIVDTMAGTYGNGSYNIAGTWESQDPAIYGDSQNDVPAQGVAQWEQRFQHFTVLGSRIQATCQTIKSSESTSEEIPGTFFINLSGYRDAITKTKQAAEIMDLPYTKRARIISAVGNNTFSSSSTVPGARLFSHYSAKKFEGVSDVLDNSNMKGHFENTVGNQTVPVEQSYFNIGLVNTMPYTVGSPTLQNQLVTVKVEYITKLTEPTMTNYVQ